MSKSIEYNGSCDNINYVVFDTDLGSDDAWGLLMLIKASSEKLKNIQILGITCVHGNSTIQNVSKNALRVLETVGRTDIPVYLGASSPILPHTREFKYFAGKDGFGDVAHDTEVDISLIQKNHAVNHMYDLVCKYPKQVSFILVGPLTNFALCINMYPDFAKNVKDVYIMGGNMRAVGNATASSEFNFFADPEAAFIVLNKSEYPITILPWETCLEPSTISIDWRFTVISSVNNRVTQLLDPVEKSCYLTQGWGIWMPCDAFLVAVFLFPEKFVKKYTKWHASVELSGNITRGQMVLDHLRYNSENITLIENIDCEYFKELSMWAVNQKDAKF